MTKEYTNKLRQRNINNPHFPVAKGNEAGCGTDGERSGDELAPENHSQFAASILRPYVRAEVTWVVEMHGLFQMQFYAHHYGKDATAHLTLKDHPWFASAQRFVEKYDQAAFDPAYPTRPLSYFEPMLRTVFGRAPFAQAEATAT